MSASNGGHALWLESAATDSAILISQVGAADAIVIAQVTANRGLWINKPNTDGGECILVTNTGTGPGVSIRQDGAGYGINITQNGNSNAINMLQSAASSALVITQAVAIPSNGASLKINQNASAGRGLQIDINHTANINSAISINNNGLSNDITGSGSLWSAKGGRLYAKGLAFLFGTNVPIRIVWGEVDRSGIIRNAGSGGWTVIRTGVGLYTLSFSPAFVSAPMVLVQGQCDTGVAGIGGSPIGDPTVSSAQILIWNTGGVGVGIDRNWWFCAIGAV
jgi:hypothetical protein